MKKLIIAVVLAGVVGQYVLATNLVNFSATDLRDVEITRGEKIIFSGALGDQEWLKVSRLKDSDTIKVTTDNCETDQCSCKVGSGQCDCDADPGQCDCTAASCETATLEVANVPKLGIKVDKDDWWAIYRICNPGDLTHNQLALTEIQERKA